MVGLKAHNFNILLISHWKVPDTDYPHQYCRSAFEEDRSPYCFTDVPVDIPKVARVLWRQAFCDIPICSE